MPYHTLRNTLDPEFVKQGWQLRVAIDVNALIETNEKNQFKLIKHLLERELKKYNLNVKLTSIKNPEELTNYYDGTLSPFGKDRTQLGKEICIYFPDENAAVDKKLTSAEIKMLIKKLWHVFDVNNIPLVYFEKPGDKSIPGPYGLPTPFSITWEGTDEFIGDKRVKQYEKTNGILLKKFDVENAVHPLMGVEFNDRDILDPNYDYRFKPDVGYITRHLESVTKQLAIDEGEIKKSDFNFSDLLFSDNYLKRLKEIVRLYQKSLDDLTNDSSKDEDIKSEEREKLQHQFLIDIKPYQDFFNHYPRKSDCGLSFCPELHLLINSPAELTADQLENDIIKLRNFFYNACVKIHNDNLYLKPGNNSIMEINLIKKDPFAYQVLYRRRQLISQEQQALESVQETINRVNSLPNTFIERALFGIKNYQSRYDKFVGFFQRIIDGKQGRTRANYYLDKLNNANDNNLDKFKALYALFKSKDGATLQADVTKAIFGDKITDIHAARRRIGLHLAHLMGNGYSLKELDSTDSITILNEANGTLTQAYGRK